MWYLTWRAFEILIDETSIKVHDLFLSRVLLPQPSAGCIFLPQRYDTALVHSYDRGCLV